MAIALVICTGDNTSVGKIAKLASSTKLRMSTLQKEVRNFVKLVGVLSVSMALSCFLAAVFIQGTNTVEEVVSVFVNGFLVIMVANVPQGLPAMVTLLSLAAQNMAKRLVFLKRIDCFETVGSTSIICSDKMGTLTRNEMAVTDIWYDGRIIKCHKREGASSLFGQGPQALFHQASILCNSAKPIDEQVKNDSRRKLLDHAVQRAQQHSRLIWRYSSTKSVLALDVDNMHLPQFKGNPSDAALIT
jgi:magnesium-transporting ATPase (P-type)